MNGNAKPAAKEPAGKPIQSMDKKPNIWLVVSIILAIALVGVIFTNYSKGTAKDSGTTTVEAQAAGQTLLNFINEVYAAQVGTAVLKGVTAEGGLYQVDVSVADPQTGQPIDQTIFITQDGKYFVPQIVEIDAVLTQFRALQQQQLQQVPVNAQPVDDSLPVDDQVIEE